MLPIFPQYRSERLASTSAFDFFAKPSYDQLFHRKFSFWTSSLKLALYNLPSGTSIFNREIQRFRQFRSSLRDRRQIIISTNRLSKSFLERLRLNSVPFLRFITTFILRKNRQYYAYLLSTRKRTFGRYELYIAIGFYQLFETFRIVLRQKDNDRDNDIFSSIRTTLRSFVLFFPIWNLKTLFTPHTPSLSPSIPRQYLTMKVMCISSRNFEISAH